MTSSPLYDAYYYAHGCGEPYQRNPTWLSVFGAMAERIVGDIAPKTVMDAGCALGLLVETLRERGVEAWGVDLSEFAIQNAHPSVKPFCSLGSVTQPFPHPHYDLIVCIEVLEHLTPDEADQAVLNFTRHADAVLFSSTPNDFREASHVNVQPPEYWVELFGRHGFAHDVDFDATFITPWAMLMRRTSQPANRLVAAYERRLWLLSQENQARRQFGVDQRLELAGMEQDVRRLTQNLQDLGVQRDELARQLEEIRHSQSWQVIQKAQDVRLRTIPLGSRRERLMYGVLNGMRLLRREGLLAFLKRLNEKATRRAKISLLRWRYNRKRKSQGFASAILPPPPLEAHQSSVDIIICVHNALEDVKNCLESLVRYTTPPYHLILVDDGSQASTQAYLAEFAQSQGAELLRNEQAGGYAPAANQGMRRATGDYVLLLNSDTILTPRWLDRLVACAESDPRIGLVGPLANTASWQSIPAIFNEQGDWAENPLPDGLSIASMGEQVAAYSARAYPRLPFLNGFCLLIRRQVIEQIGVFDAENFESYGEENDYCLRAAQAGWQMAVADDTYIYHAQSRSYSHERRKQLAERSDKALAAKHGQSIISQGAYQCRYDRQMLGLRARSAVMGERERLIQEGSLRWEGKRVVFVLPIVEPGGGGHVILQEAEAMLKMGVAVELCNLKPHQGFMERDYPDLQLPTVYVGSPEQAPRQLTRYDAAIGTVYHSLEWLDFPPLEKLPVRGYYIQDFEPGFFPEGSQKYLDALKSYTRFPDLVRVTKTDWNRQVLLDKVGVDSSVVGASVNIDLYRPRRRSDLSWPDRPLRIAAMVRPSTPRRQPGLTMQVLREAAQQQRGAIEVVIFGCDITDPDFHRLPTNFPFRNVGVLTRGGLAALLNEVDVFADFSSFQAMGLTALEAMASGAAVVVPQQGGAQSFARHEVNALITDTSSQQACLDSLNRLIREEGLRTRLQQQALTDACQHFPEKAAYATLEALFPGSR